ncbi:MAG TPA: MATE family efflux transporter [Terriglobia bacterium]|nr:MATE family efflux transporter [Terriglobia bacterium]
MGTQGVSTQGQAAKQQLTVGHGQGTVEGLRHEFRSVLRLAWPLALANLGWMFMGLVDTMMVGRVSAEAIDAVSLGGILFATVALFGGGIMLGLDAMIPAAFGAGRLEECHRSLFAALQLSLVLAAVLMAVLWYGTPLLGRAGINPAVLPLTLPYVRVLLWSMVPLLVYFSFRGYLQGMSLVRPIMFALLSANVVNAAGDWVLIYGHFHFPALGAVGSAWSTTIARIYMAFVLLTVAVRHDRRNRTGLFSAPVAPDWNRIARLLRLGLPAALQITLEVGVFAAATALIARLDVASLAAHQIAMNAATFTYMVPLGIASAAAVRVGQALGRGDPRAASRSGWAAIALGAGFMSGGAILFLLAPHAIARAFTPDVSVIRIGVSLLFVVALFQLFDGVQTVATGALRGAGDTRTPMMCHLCGYWLLGLPLGYFLGFHERLGAVGLWLGLCAALIVIGCVLLAVWRQKVSAMREEAA